jgi:hypothetical protein
MATIPSQSNTLNPGGPVVSAANSSIEPGDRLNRAEFERRWQLMSRLKRAELIDGVVYMNAAVSYPHGDFHGALAVWLGVYVAATPKVSMAAEPSIRLDDQNMPQPDVTLRLDASIGGRSWIDNDGYLTGAPELVAEAASSSVSYDLHQKLDVYRRFGVREYVVVRIRDLAIDWFRLVDGQYVSLAPDDDGILRSSLFHGLWLDPAALLRGDQARVLTVLNAGLASDEHRTQTTAWGGAVS